jgi:hypothetical protein
MTRKPFIPACRAAAALLLTLPLAPAAQAAPRSAQARMKIEFTDITGLKTSSLPPYLQCVPYARMVSASRSGRCAYLVEGRATMRAASPPRWAR